LTNYMKIHILVVCFKKIEILIIYTLCKPRFHWAHNKLITLLCSKLQTMPAWLSRLPRTRLSIWAIYKNERGAHLWFLEALFNSKISGFFSLQSLNQYELYTSINLKISICISYLSNEETAQYAILCFFY
jgi:hypothetical protein